ncbi:MAG: DUF2971 domain-containing protein [Balneolaceae bacterium]
MKPVLYKYFDFSENFKKSLRNGYLWFSRPTEFNDPFEFKLQVDEDLGDSDILEYFNLYKKLSVTSSSSKKVDFNKVLLKYKTDPKKFTEFYLAPFAEYIRNFGVCCFSSINDNILMWSHYANSHRGLVIEFDPKQLYESIYELNDSAQITTIRTVTYSNKFPLIKISSSLEKTSLEIEKAVITKSKDWRYEKEMRIISQKSGKHLINRNCIKRIYLDINFQRKIKEN